MSYIITEYLIIEYKKTSTTKIKISKENVYHNYNINNDIINYKNKLYEWWSNYIYNTYPKFLDTNIYYKKIKYIKDNKINPKNIKLIYITKEFSWKP